VKECTLPTGLNQNRGFKHGDSVFVAVLGLLAHGFKGTQSQLSDGCSEGGLAA
jgi:hypothetical protein